MSKKFLRLVWRQMDVQIRIRTLNWYTLLLFVLQPAIFSGVGMLLLACRRSPRPRSGLYRHRRRHHGHVEWSGLHLHFRHHP